MGVALPSFAGSAFLARETMHASSARPGLAGDASADECTDTAAVRAFAGVGLAALFAIPLLMTASLASGFPFAVPAIIAIGYLGVAQALRTRARRRAKRVAVLLMAAFLACAVIASLSDGRGGTAIALLVPAFAAAPALVRRVIAVRDDPRLARARIHAATLAACAPEDVVLFVAGDGMLLASTEAADDLVASLQLKPGDDLAAALPLADRALLLNALRHPAGRGGSTFELHFGKGAGDIRIASLRLIEAGLMALRLVEAVPGTELPAAAPAQAGAGTGPMNDETTPLGEAISFALRHAAASRTKTRLDIECSVPERLAVRIGRAPLRQILVRLVEAAAASGGEGGEPAALRIEARQVRGAVLLRVEAPLPPTGLPQRHGERALAQLADLVDAAGGTMIVAPAAEARIITLRLQPAIAGKATGTV